MAGEPKGISFVVPVYNEAGVIRQTLEEIDRVLAGTGLDYEIIAVNDGSRDGSGEAAAGAPNTRVISHPTNCGYGAALKTGIRNSRFAWIGIVDADGTYPIAETPRLLEKMEQGFDMVVAKRSNVLNLDKPVKKFFRSLFIKVLSALLDRKVEDPNSGLRLFRKDLAMQFLPFLCNTFSFTTSITVFAFGNASFVTYVPVEYAVRKGTKSKVRHIRDSFRTAQLVIQGVMFYNPVKFAILVAAGFLVLGAVPGLLLAALGWATAGWMVFWAVAVTAVMVLMGLLFDMLRIATLRNAPPDRNGFIT